MVFAAATKLKAFASECRSVLTVTKKPTRDELVTVAKVSGIGIGLIGLIGFVLQIFNKLILR